MADPGLSLGPFPVVSSTTRERRTGRRRRRSKPISLRTAFLLPRAAFVREAPSRLRSDEHRAVEVVRQMALRDLADSVANDLCTTR